MYFNDEVDWPKLFEGYISRPSLADPHNPRRSVYVATMVFLEGALREIDDQLSGRNRRSRDELAGARLTRAIVLRRAAEVLAELPCGRRDPEVPDELPCGKRDPEVPDKLPCGKRDPDVAAELPCGVRAGEVVAELPCEVRVGEGAFRDRWPGSGGMANFFMCLVKYTCTAPRWGLFLDYGPRRVLAELPRVRAGELELTDLITKIATHDLRMRIRLARYWLFQLSLTIDSKWRSVATQAYREMLHAYSARWAPVYEEGLRVLGVRFRPGITPEKLSAMVSAQTSGFAQHVAGAGDDARDSRDLFVASVLALIYAALDPGDGRDVGEALRGLLG